MVREADSDPDEPARFYLGEDGELWEEIDEGEEVYTEYASRCWVVLRNFHDHDQIEQWWTDQDGYQALRELTPMEVVAHAAR